MNYSLGFRSWWPHLPKFDLFIITLLVLTHLAYSAAGQVAYLRNRVRTYPIYAPTAAVAPPISYRQSRSDDGTFEYQAYPRTRTFYSSSPSGSSTSLSQPTTAPTSSPSGFTRNYIENSHLPSVIKHSGTCTYDRSQAACTFSLICYLANGSPSEGCDGEDPSVTCCYLSHQKSVASQSPQSTITSDDQPVQVAHKADSSVSSVSSNSPLIYRTYASAFDSAPVAPSSSMATYHNTLIGTNGGGYPYSSSPKFASLSKYPTFLSVLPPEAPVPMMSKPKFIDSSPSSSGSGGGGEANGYRLKYDSFEIKPPYHQSYNQPASNSDYANSVIRRTRTELSQLAATNGKSYFQEVASRKFYARNYDADDVCGRPMAKPRSRIIGGQDAYFGEFPWQVHIKITKHQCGGALINSQFVVTAAHCIYQAPMRQLNVIIGAHDIEDPRYQDIPPQYFGVTKVILHPNFRFSASHPDRYDIALIKLDKEVRYSDSVLPVCLPDENVNFEGWKGVVTGWGKTDPALSNRYGTRLLQKVDVPIINNDKCEGWHRARGIDLRIFNEMMCAGYEDGQKDACVGDSGGPLVINVNGRWTLAGITSAGFGCAQSKQPGIYHRVANTVEWVKTTLRMETELDANIIQRSK